MGKMRSLFKKGVLSLVGMTAAGWVLYGCATIVDNQAATEKAKAPVIEAVKVSSSQDQTVVEFMNSEPVFYTAFKLQDPPRIVLDLRGVPGAQLPRSKEVNSAGVKHIVIEEGKTQVMTTRAVIHTTEPLLYHTEPKGNVIALTLMSEKPLAAPVPEKKTAAVEKTGVTPFEPRIFFKDTPGPLTQILGIDFTLLDQGKSRLIVTTDKKTKYDLNQQGPKTLILKVPDATIPPLIMRHLDSKHFEGAVDWVKASLSQKDVAIAITLREMVPFHVKQTESAITIDFGPTVIKPPEKKIVPLQPAQAPAQTSGQALTQTIIRPVHEHGGSSVIKLTPIAKEGEPVIVAPPEAGDPRAPKVYTGERMTMDFVNADVTNVLRLIGEVSNLNIVWGPEVRGTVSMRFKDIPWDQALDLILENNNLGKRQAGNVIWIAPRTVIANLERAEQEKIVAYNKKLEEQKKQKEEEKKQEPMVTEYIPIDFAKADEIKPLIKTGIGLTPGDEVVLDAESGRARRISTDSRTNTIILTDLMSNVQKAKDIAKQFDQPVKQVMIEARIVDATDSFVRDLGLRWDQFQIQKLSDTTIPWTTMSGLDTAPSDPTAFPVPPAGKNVSPTFTSNAPEGWRPNLGLVFSTLSGSGLTATVLDAKLALAESEGKTKIISAPKVLAMNGQAATIKRGDQIIIPATENVPSQTIDANLSLKVTPTVSYNNFVSLELDVTDDQAITAARIQKKAITTKLMIKNGDTVVIGGIYTETERENEEGIPGLRRVPLLGWLFKARSINNQKTELLIFLTPTVVASTFKS